MPSVGLSTCLLYLASIHALSGVASLSPPTSIHIPLIRTQHPAPNIRRSDINGLGYSGLGDYQDVAYSVLIEVGNTTLPILVDTGSADLWVLSDTCSKKCTSGVPTYPHKHLNYSGVDARIFYGDSSTSTFALGPIGRDTVKMANISIGSQYFAVINETTTTTSATGAAGIAGFGFSLNSVIFNALFNYEYPAKSLQASSSSHSSSTPTYTSTSTTRLVVRSPSSMDLRTSTTPIAISLQELATVNDLLHTFITNGPVVARMSFDGLLREPSFTVTLQRDVLDIGGNAGLLSLGGLPPGVQNSSLTWSRVRLYTVQEGGISASPAAPNEVYPISWEVFIDNIYLDGAVLPPSTLSTGVSLSALLDTGSSLVRGPSDVVGEIYRRVSGDVNLSTYDCTKSHLLEFEISGTKFPIDPRDFGWQAFPDSIQHCNVSVVSTDPPSKGYLYAWTLGAPFLKSVLASFYYGNLTTPSEDPPRVGMVSTMPVNASALLVSAIAAAGDNFPAAIEPAPLLTPKLTAQGIAGVALAPSASFTTSTPTSLSKILSTLPSTPYTSPSTPLMPNKGTQSTSIRLEVLILVTLALTLTHLAHTHG